MTTHRATGCFDITMTPGEALLEGTDRLDFTKEWSGEIAGTSTGVMLSAGDPESGAAGYVALEVFTGSVAGRTGGFTLQQSGLMTGAAPVLRYEITPGSGSGDLAGITGTLTLGSPTDPHSVVLDITLPD